MHLFTWGLSMWSLIHMWVRFAETAASQMPTTQSQPAKAIELLKLKLLCSWICTCFSWHTSKEGIYCRFSRLEHNSMRKDNFLEVSSRSNSWIRIVFDDLIWSDLIRSRILLASIFMHSQLQCSVLLHEFLCSQFYNFPPIWGSKKFFLKRKGVISVVIVLNSFPGVPISVASV